MASPAEGEAAGPGIAGRVAEQAFPDVGRCLALRELEGQLADGRRGALRMP